MCEMQRWIWLSGKMRERNPDIDTTMRTWCEYADVEPLEQRIEKLEEALQNISNGDTPWMDSDGCHTTPAEIYQKYAKQVLAMNHQSEE